MASSSGNNVTEADTGLNKWQLALYVGIPVAVGASVAGIWYYKSKSARKPKSSDAEKAGIPTADSTPAGSSGHVSKHAEASEPEPLDPLEKAQTAKNKGNKYFKGGKYDKAIECYTEAIEVCPAAHDTDMATFHQNRAAAYEQLKNYHKVIDDCSNALKYNKKYVKALFRRAKAYENTEKLNLCLEDVTAVCILEGFSNQHSLLMADRVLKALGKSKAQEKYLNREPVTPSPQFIRTYFSAFVNDPFINSLSEGPDAGNVSTPDSAGSEPEKHQDETPEKEQLSISDASINKTKFSGYSQVKQCFNRSEYADIVSHCSAELADPQSAMYADALLLRATFYLLRGEGNKALEDLDQLLQLDNVDKRLRSNALIKRGSLKMQNGQQPDALLDFALAVKEDPENSDIYHHRGQLNLLVDKVEDAVQDFQKSVTLSPNFAIAHVQKCYTEYRLAFSQRNTAKVQSAVKEFEDTIDRFPNCAEGYALYGQALCDQQMFMKADENFQKASELEPDNGNIYVHRGLLRLQWKQDIEEAAKYINQALDVDTKCEFAYETLGTIEVQRGYLDRAIDLFNTAISLAKTEVEMSHLFSLLDAAVAQSQVAKKYGLTAGPPGEF